MDCTTEPEFQSSRPRNGNRCCHRNRPEPGAWEHCHGSPRVFTRWRWNGRRQSRCVMRDADADGAAVVVRRVVNAVGDADAAGVGAIVIVHSNRRTIPFSSDVFEVPDQFSLLTVDADDGKTLTLEACPQRGNMLELLIPIRTRVGGDLLPVNTQKNPFGRAGEKRYWPKPEYRSHRENSAMFSVVLRVHFSPVMGSPAVSCSRMISISIISGVFSHQLAPAASFARTIHLHILGPS